MYRSRTLAGPLMRAYKSGAVPYSTRGAAVGISEEGHKIADFDEGLLEFLACPLSKTPLRWDADTSSLICDELGVGYPVKNGMPNLRPVDGHVIEARDKESSSSQQPWGDTDASPK